MILRKQHEKNIKREIREMLSNAPIYIKKWDKSLEDISIVTRRQFIHTALKFVNFISINEIEIEDVTQKTVDNFMEQFKDTSREYQITTYRILRNLLSFLGKQIEIK